MTVPDERVYKDLNAQRPVANAWRPTLCRIVEALARRDYSLAKTGDSAVEPLSAEKSKRIEAYIASYGESLIELPEEAWKSSVSQWMGTHWDIAVDMFTAESGRSDLVLTVRVFENAGGYRYEVDSVHAP